MALRGLDEADELRESGVDREKSLRLYELSLELLILYLKDEENQRRIPEVDASTVAARLGVALSDAEELKATLPKRKPGEIQAMFGGGLFSALSDALVGRGKKAAPAVAKISGAAPSTAKTLPTRKLPVKRTTRQRPAAPDLSKVNAAQSGSPSSKGTATSTDKSQIHQAVLDDLLVNPESVQETSWDDIAGLEEVKQSLQESAILPLVRPDLFTGLRRPQNVLLWGYVFLRMWWGIRVIFWSNTHPKFVFLQSTRYRKDHARASCCHGERILSFCMFRFFSDEQMDGRSGEIGKGSFSGSS